MASFKETSIISFDGGFNEFVKHRLTDVRGSIGDDNLRAVYNGNKVLVVRAENWLPMVSLIELPKSGFAKPDELWRIEVGLKQSGDLDADSIVFKRDWMYVQKYGSHKRDHSDEIRAIVGAMPQKDARETLWKIIHEL